MDVVSGGASWADECVDPIAATAADDDRVARKRRRFCSEEALKSSTPGFIVLNSGSTQPLRCFTPTIAHPGATGDCCTAGF
jgi:hypothetical protein